MVADTNYRFVLSVSAKLPGNEDFYVLDKIGKWYRVDGDRDYLSGAWRRAIVLADYSDLIDRSV